MQQLFIVYVREKYKNYSSLFSAFEYKLRALEIKWWTTATHHDPPPAFFGI